MVRTDFGDIGKAFRGADYPLAMTAVPLYFFGFWIRTLRWHYLLRPINDISIGRLYPIVLIGQMANNLAPGRIGELVRAYLLGESASMSQSTALGTIAVDRALDGLTLVALLGVVVAFSGANASVKSIGIGSALLFIAASTVLAALAFSPRSQLWLMRLLAFLPSNLTLRLEEVFDFLVDHSASFSPKSPVLWP